MRTAADAAGVQLVTGDTKVVDHGKADGLFVNTAGLGPLVATAPIGPAEVQAGDAVILSGDVGRHGIAVMAAREGFGFETVIESDCAPVVEPVLALIEAGIAVHCLRDLTRGGLASAVVEIAETAGVSIALDEAAIPVRDDVACRLRTARPRSAACRQRGAVRRFRRRRGRRAGDRHPAALSACPPAPCGSERRAQSPAGEVSCRGALGVARIIDMLSGEQLPRIC